MLQTANCKGGKVGILHSTGVQGAESGLTPEHLRVYRWALSRPFVSVSETADVLGLTESEARQAVEYLEQAHLMEKHDERGAPPGAPREPARETRWRIVNPQIAASRLAASESRLRQSVVALGESRRQLDELFDVYSVLDGRRTPRHSVEVFAGLLAVAALTDRAALACEREAVSCRPEGPPPGAPSDPEAARDLALLARGVRLRVLYRHSARHHPPLRAHLEQLVAAGAEVRTTPEPFGALTAYDRSVGFIPHHTLPEGTAVIRDPSTLAFLHRVFDQSWDVAAPFDGPPGAAVQCEQHDTILRLLSEGARDETIARRLGMSLRTCRRHIAEAFKEMGAQSRFQAGYLTGRGGRTG
ncbi:hypothetical protein ELQ87_00580 [Streptomyces griseoviridis]|uniref:HTH luxR-type domain-containing protein n=1 Tax=Streptomyces griseoviridis TaxID=45398 RepID=A0A3S9Z5J2_STRGD|nr:hypothetical protein ELQ87_00580 [Streptomyces griseoviridis]QCN90190.1 hypothetical protein DDJ31_38780 [Streptomyces griseoviridis]